IYDLLYPSYGDTYPIYNGSIGMTYEQGGIGAGLAIALRSGDTLTLADRIAHHVPLSMSTIGTASANAQKVLDEFKKYYDDARDNPPGEYKTYVIKNDNPDKIALLGVLLHRNGIRYGNGVKANANGYDYVTGKTEQLEIDKEDIIISAYQPKAVLTNVLLEPKTFVADSDTYDITAWSLPYAYGLRAYGLKEKISPATMIRNRAEPFAPAPVADQHFYAYVCPWQSIYDVKFLAALWKKHIKLRCAETPFEAAGRKFSAGSIIIPRAGNNTADFDRVVNKLAAECGRRLVALNTGFSDKGADLGSESIKFLHAPKIMLISGEGTSAEAMGEIWFYFEKEIGYPVTLVRYNNLGRIKWSDYDVAIFPDGDYDDLPTDKLQNWVSEGGRLIALQSTIGQLVGKKGFSIKNLPPNKKDKSDTAANKDGMVKAYANRDHDAIRSNVPGAIFKVDMDNTHPLGYGLDKYYFTLKLDDVLYSYLGDDGWNVGTVKKNSYVEGFVGQKAKEKIKNGLLFGVQSLGRGTVVYLVDDPLFRSFWQNGKLLFSNAVFMVGQ
ncbi:MAG: zinc carboxypeptidase, partial [Bacteroidetes bacterium]|nr:zinc carboxypeptidase [Bacteroidota bacterium]